MSQLRILRLGADEEGPEVYRELAQWLAIYLHARSELGILTMVSDLRSALLLLVSEIDEQMVEVDMPDKESMN